ncbi:hypothetical protein F5Y09DRAFT_304912 [Xylaria sp. FL1042]|nr:hypothetical protein F5Y09DRAFT_304912 [Xylaria sp. FL1042]
MRAPLVLAALPFAITAKAQNFSSYVPECAPPCVEQTLNSTKLCTGLDDNECLCNSFQPIVLSSRICFVQTCNNTNIEEIRSEITSGWQKFCNESGIPVDLTAGWSVDPSSWPTSSSPTSSTTLSTTSPTSSSTAASDTTPTPISGGLSTGAKAGIGVGAGVGSLLVISGLVFLGFRLGRRKGRGSESNAGNTPPASQGTYPETNPSGTADWSTAEGGGDVWAYKPQTPVAELPSPSSPVRHAELPAHDVGELQTNEPPAELWHGVMPPELSADAEIPRIANTTR